jgi:hypothetical protein
LAYVGQDYARLRAGIRARRPDAHGQKGYAPHYEISLEVLKSLPYNRWRDANAEDTLRFYWLRLREVGMIKTDPQKLIAQGTDGGS